VKDQGQAREGRGREATTAAILAAAEELFSAQGFSAVTVRAIAERAGVSHALVHRYIGSKTDIFRAVLANNESAIVSAAPDNPDLLESAGLMLRHARKEHGRVHIRLLVRSALSGLPFDMTTGRFEATERLIELAEQAARSASPAERAAKDIEPRLVVAACVALLLGWSVSESWLRPAAGIADMDETEVEDGIERMFRGILSANVPGLKDDDQAAC
jgi:AcrR family transcriptional regulator